MRGEVQRHVLGQDVDCALAGRVGPPVVKLSTIFREISKYSKKAPTRASPPG